MNPAKNVFDYPFFIEQKSVILKCMFDVRACLRERKKCNNKLVV